MIRDRDIAIVIYSVITVCNALSTGNVLRSIFRLQPRDRAAVLVEKKYFFSQNLHDERV